VCGGCVDGETGLCAYCDDFILRGLEAGIVIAVIAPLIGMFLVLRRYSLIADTLAHVSLAGVALGFLFTLNPVFTAIVTSAVSSVFIERLRMTKKVYGESALAIFLSGSLAFAIILLSLSRGFGTDLFSYLFGSIVTVRTEEVMTILVVGLCVVVAIALLFKELVFVSFDEEAAQVAGIPTRMVNTMLILLTALTVSLAMPIVGILLISALMVIPVVAALQMKKSFKETLLLAELISVFSMVSGIFVSFYLNLSAGGTIVMIAFAIFLGILAYQKSLDRWRHSP
jgi:zinc transport system permease protein